MPKKKSQEVTRAEMNQPSEYGGTPGDEPHVSGNAASARSRIVRSDPTDPGRG